MYSSISRVLLGYFQWCDRLGAEVTSSEHSLSSFPQSRRRHRHIAFTWGHQYITLWCTSMHGFLAVPSGQLNKRLTNTKTNTNTYTKTEHLYWAHSWVFLSQGADTDISLWLCITLDFVPMDICVTYVVYLIWVPISKGADTNISLVYLFVCHVYLQLRCWHRHIALTLGSVHCNVGYLYV